MSKRPIFWLAMAIQAFMYGQYSLKTPFSLLTLSARTKSPFGRM